MPVSHGKGREARREERREQRREKEREERREKGREGPRANARNCLRGSDSGDGLFRTSPSFSRMATFRVLEAARAVADEIHRLLGSRKLRLIHRAQLRDSTQSIAANIREGMGRTPGPHRNQAYRDARGSAEEADEHLRANFADGRIPAEGYWRLHNRIALVVRILTTIIDK